MGKRLSLTREGISPARWTHPWIEGPEPSRDQVAAARCGRYRPLKIGGITVALVGCSGCLPLRRTARVVRGSDGNLLQHTCELAALRAVVHEAGTTACHLYCTHACAAEAAMEASDGRGGRGQLQIALNLAAALNKALPPGTPPLRRTPLIDVYAALGVNDERSPTSAGVLVCEAKRRGIVLQGTLIEKDPAKARLLASEFPPPGFQVVQGDWRARLAYVRDRGTPWILAMAPVTFTVDRSDPDINPDDLLRAGSVATKALASPGHPGLICVVVHGLDKGSRDRFFLAVADAFGHLECDFIGVEGRDASRQHVAALISPQPRILAAAVAEVRGSIKTTDPFD